MRMVFILNLTTPSSYLSLTANKAALPTSCQNVPCERCKFLFRSNALCKEGVLGAERNREQQTEVRKEGVLGAERNRKDRNRKHPFPLPACIPSVNLQQKTWTQHLWTGMLGGSH
jgi:hypothetical protein